MTQEQLGRLLGSSQSRVAKMEAADRSVSIDLMVRSLLRMGATRKEPAAYGAKPTPKRERHSGGQGRMGCAELPTGFLKSSR